MKVKTKVKKAILEGINGPDDLKKVDPKNYKLLAQELRDLLIECTSKNGGHVSPNLGVVELTMAIHTAFNSPKDKIIWDIGHQSYIHKMLTGRWNRMHTIRQKDGLCGFCHSDESKHDAFNAGHAGTSISVATGMAISRDHLKKKHNVVAIIGDGSIASGMSLEALNHIGYLKTDITIIFNDNDFSIAPNVGALSMFTKNLDETPMSHTSGEDLAYLNSVLDDKSKKILNNIKKDIHPYIQTPSMIFEKFGYRYFGPFDGHDTETLIDALKRSKKRKGPQIIHVRTVKGKGYLPAENNPEIFHGLGPYNKLTGKPKSKSRKTKTYPELACDVLLKLAKKDKKIIAITPGTPLGTGIKKFGEVYPDRFYDVGIAEQHAVTFAAGMAKTGLKPVISIYSTFLQRAYDQIVHDVCIQNLPVVFLARSGLVEDGETHQGVFDVSYLRHIPNLIVMSPKDDAEFQVMIKNAFEFNCPVVILHPKGETVRITKSRNIKIGEGELIRKGKDIALFAFGSMVKPALDIADQLMAYGIKTYVVNTRFAKHIDKKLLSKITNNVTKIVTLEEFLIHGGVGSRVLEVLADLNKKNISVKQIGIPDEYIVHGNPKLMKEKHSLDNKSIINQIVNFFKLKK